VVNRTDYSTWTKGGAHRGGRMGKDNKDGKDGKGNLKSAEMRVCRFFLLDKSTNLGVRFKRVFKNHTDVLCLK
jgi:hypothetical protein